MKKKSITELFRNKKFAVGCAAAALALVIGSVAMVQKSATVPKLPSYTDPIMEVSIEDEETPLAAAPKVTTKTTKKTTKKNVKLKSAATKTYTKKLPAIKKTTSKTKNSTAATVKTQTTILTAATEKYTKKSKVKVVTTTVTTTVKTTTTAKNPGSSASSSAIVQAGASGKHELDVAKAAPLMDSRVISAYKKLGFTVTVDPSASYAGYFDARTRSIILQREDTTIYHELGHFLAFISGNADTSSSFAAVYSQEKAAFAGVNKAYTTQNSSEYFAESLKDYTQNASALKSARPKTYQALVSALDKVTDAQVSKMQLLYGPIWK